MGFNTVGQENQTQRPYMGKNHIWAKTIYEIQHSGTGKSDPKDDRIQHSWQENQTQRPYMGFNTVGQGSPLSQDPRGCVNEWVVILYYWQDGRQYKPILSDLKRSLWELYITMRNCYDGRSSASPAPLILNMLHSLFLGQVHLFIFITIIIWYNKK